MRVKERILSIRLIDSEKNNSNFMNEAGIRVDMKTMAYNKELKKEYSLKKGENDERL